MPPKTMDEIKEIMRAAGEERFKTLGSSATFDDFYDDGTKEYKYSYTVKIGDTIYDWSVSDSHRKGRHLTSARELWIFGGQIPVRTKFSVGTKLTKSDLNHIVKTIHEDQIRLFEVRT